MGTVAISLNSVLESVDKLDLEDQQYLKEILQHRLVDAKRSALVRRATQARTAMRKKKTKSGTAKDLLADLND